MLLVRESGGRKAPRVRYSGGANAYMAADLDKQVPIRAGSRDLEVSVQVVWALG